MQLMPAILTLGLKTVNNATGAVCHNKSPAVSLSAFSSPAKEGGGTAESAQYPQPTASQLETLENIINDGLDFGVAAVWVCPNSCEGSSMEQALVSVPADF